MNKILYTLRRALDATIGSKLGRTIIAVTGMLALFWFYSVVSNTVLIKSDRELMYTEYFNSTTAVAHVTYTPIATMGISFVFWLYSAVVHVSGYKNETSSNNYERGLVVMLSTSLVLLINCVRMILDDVNAIPLPSCVDPTPPDSAYTGMNTNFPECMIDGPISIKSFTLLIGGWYIIKSTQSNMSVSLLVAVLFTLLTISHSIVYWIANIHHRPQIVFAYAIFANIIFNGTLTKIFSGFLIRLENSDPHKHTASYRDEPELEHLQELSELSLT